MILFLKKGNGRFFTWVIVSALILSICPLSAFSAEYNCMDPFDLVIYSGKSDGVVAKAYTSNYDNNIYVSLSDLSAALNETGKQFSFRYAETASEGEHFLVQPGESYVKPERPSAEEPREQVWLEFRRNRLFFNGSDKKYYTYRDGTNDLYLSLTDMQLMLDVTAEFVGTNCIYIHTDVPFDPDLHALEASGYFNYINGIVLGDADTGKILFFRDPNKITSIASTSKLMTYLLLAEAADAGKISFSDSVVISENAEKLSKSADGIIKMTAGTEVPAMELLNAMLLASSNEAALALAEYAYGTEDAFVDAMNRRAEELGLNSAEFFNPHGLPVYAYNTVQTKLQNRMNASDLFTLASYVIGKYPSITEITSKQYVMMPTLEYSTANSNPLVFNMPDVTGLKTGSTNKAGYCLAASMPVTVGSETHNMILILLGSETGAERGQQAEILLRYARKYYTENGF
ncbi:MAG: serine hydrolase [Eubacteriales bacterium]|nr:serine hydrolase [Eubacteriales bacterium]